MHDFPSILARAGRLFELARVAGADEVECREAFADVVRLAGELESRITRPTTRELRADVARLERQLRDRNPGERAAIIRTRLGLSKSAYYRLRPVPVPSGTPARSNPSTHIAHGAEGRP
jgi:hypothetical protein